MKRKLLFGMLVIVFLVSGCAVLGIGTSPSVAPPDALKNPYVKTSYKVLYSLAQAYNAAWKSFKDLHEIGVVTDGTFTQGQDLARKYVKANKDAVDLLIKVENGTAGQLEAQTLMTTVQIANEAILNFLKPYLASQLKKTEAPETPTMADLEILKLPIS
jgi:hypothetical protein